MKSATWTTQYHWSQSKINFLRVFFNLQLLNLLMKTFKKYSCNPSHHPPPSTYIGHADNTENLDTNQTVRLN